MSKPIFSFDAFIDFCNSKDPNERYDYIDCENCACAQYTNSLGIRWHDAMRKSPNFAVFDHLANSNVSRTFGGLAKALEKLPGNLK